METEFGIIISEQTVRRRLHKAGFKGCVARKKSYVDKTNRMKRIQYAKRYREQPLCFWDQVLWTDESQFNLFGSDGRVMVWGTPQAAFDPGYTVPTVKHGGGNIVLGLYLVSRCRKSRFYRREHDRRSLS